MKVIIIDDESKARSLLYTIVKESQADIDAIYTAASLKEGVTIIKKENPDIVFLDIEMPEEQGLEILNYFKHEAINFEIVFTTAYSEYAIQAFEVNAIDYLLKPLRPAKVKEAIKKIQGQKSKRNIQGKLDELKKSLSNENFEKVGLPVSDGILFVKIEEIIHIEADGMYSKVYTKNDGCKTISKPLKFFNHVLENKTFFYKPHRSHIVNLQFLKQYIRKDGNYILLTNKHSVPLSNNKKDEFLNLVSSL